MVGPSTRGTPSTAPAAAAGTHLHDLRLKHRAIFAEIFEADDEKTEVFTMKQVLAAMSAHVGDAMFNHLAQKAFADTILMAGATFDGDEVVDLQELAGVVLVNEAPKVRLRIACEG